MVWKNLYPGLPLFEHKDDGKEEVKYSFGPVDENSVCLGTSYDTRVSKQKEVFLSGLESGYNS